MGMSNTLLLDCEIYPVNFIAVAINNYSKIAKISYVVGGGYYEVSFEECTYPVEQTIREFENHLIELVNVKARA
jgi:hypothetical protein